MKPRDTFNQRCREQDEALNGWQLNARRAHQEAVIAMQRGKMLGAIQWQERAAFWSRLVMVGVQEDSDV